MLLLFPRGKWSKMFGASDPALSFFLTVFDQFLTSNRFFRYICYVVALIACTRSTFGNGCILSSSSEALSDDFKLTSNKVVTFRYGLNKFRLLYFDTCSSHHAMIHPVYFDTCSSHHLHVQAIMAVMIHPEGTKCT